MKFSASALLALLLVSAHGAAAFNPSPISGTKHHTGMRSSVSLRMNMDSKTAFETVLEFNTNFKQGLKYVLVPQSANQIHPGSYYDTGVIPDLEAPLGFLDAPTTQSVSYEDMASNAESALEAAKNVVSSSFEIAAYPIDPVVPKTMAQIREALANPPSLNELHLQDYIPKGAPPGEGLATPLVNFATSSLQAIHDLPPNKFLAGMQLPQDHETLQYGFQVKTTVLDGVQGVTEGLGTMAGASSRFGSYIQENTAQSVANRAPGRELIRNTLRENFEHVKAGSVVVGEKMSANSAMIASQVKANSVMVGEKSAIMGEKMIANSAMMAEQMSTNNAHIKTTLLLNMEHLKELDYPVLSLNSFEGLSESLQQVLKTPGWKMNDVMDALKLEELGGYYAGAVVGLLLVAAMKDRQTVVKAATEGRILMAAQQKEKDDYEKKALEGMVCTLTEAVAILTQELGDLKQQKVQTNYALESMRSDVRTVIDEADKIALTEKQISMQLVESDAKNDFLRNQLDAVQFEVSTLREVNDALKIGIAAIEEQKALTPRPPVTPPKVQTAAPVGDFFFASSSATVAAVVVEKATQPSAPIKIKKEPKKAVDDNDWSTLPFTAVKRKPITDIINYLRAKGVSINGPNGKPLKKPELIDTVYACA